VQKWAYFPLSLPIQWILRKLHAPLKSQYWEDFEGLPTRKAFLEPKDDGKLVEDGGLVFCVHVVGLNAVEDAQGILEEYQCLVEVP
jgi:hypothetical protein